MAGRCSKCEEYEWNEAPELSIVWVDSETREQFCVFHAPSGVMKRNRLGGEALLPAEYNSKVFDRINSAIERNSGVTMSGAVFPWSIKFSIFSRSNHFRDISFRKATFLSDVEFENAHFSGIAEFKSAEFCGLTKFMNVDFEGETNFWSAHFEKNVEFWLCNFSKTVNFAKAQFDNTATFENVFFSSEANFSACKSSKNSVMMLSIGVDVEGIFEGSNRQSRSPSAAVGNIRFTCAEVQKMYFRGCSWPPRLGLESNSKAERDTFVACEELYRAMKQRALEEHDQQQASHWHYREKLTQLKSQLMPDQDALGDLNSVEDDSRPTMSRVRSWASLFMRIPWPLRRSLLFWYWSTSGFGERPRRAGWCLAFVVVLPLATAALGQIVGVWPPGSFDGAALSGVITDWQRALPLVKVPAETAPTGWQSLWYNAFQLVITIQAALFGFAVRNRFRR